ncbi:MAG: M1 family aminopeptidase [Deltaproteobacteria bacterium]
MIRSKNLARGAIAAMIVFFMTFIVGPATGQETDGVILNHSLDISVDIKAGTIEGTDTITYKDRLEDIDLLIRNNSEVLSVFIGGSEINFTTIATDATPSGLIRIKAELPEGVDTAKGIRIRFRSIFPSIESARQEIRRGVAHVRDGVIGEEGVFLPSSSFWYPQEESGPASFDLKVRLPAGYTSVSEGERMSAKRDGAAITERWRSTRPVDGADLVAARFMVEKVKHGSIDIYTFFFLKDERLSKLYIDKTKAYIDLYSEEFGPYPFEKFAVVESFLPTGYGMPSFTLLGSSVLRLPFIPDTSLGHEIAHNWWGNSVYIDETKGNWVEALTTYTADYRYEQKKSAKDAMTFRLSKLRGYKNFASGTRLALRDFTDATTIESRAVGYNKGVMVFNMLKMKIGEKAFSEGLKALYKDYAFKKASWADIRSVFEKASGKSLKRFFDEWVDSIGGPSITIEKAVVSRAGVGYNVAIMLGQKAPAYALTLPVLVTTEEGAIWREVSIDTERTEVNIEVRGRPLSIEIDPEYQVFRLLSDRELPPSFASIFGDKNGIIAIPDKDPEAYDDIAQLLSKDYGLAVKKASEVTDEDLNTRSVLIVGEDNILIEKTGRGRDNEAVVITPEDITVDGKTFQRKIQTIAVATKNPLAPGRVICYILGDAQGANEAGRRLRYFTEWSYVVFGGDQKPVKGMIEGKNPLRRAF